VPEPSFSTVQLHQLVEAFQAGDRSAADHLLRSAGERLERLARRMLRRFPGVRRWADTGDVLQNATLRLLRALREVRPANTREFFGLAAEQMRREVLDLARHFYGPRGQGANHASAAGPAAAGAAAFDPPDRAEDAAELERWCAFHEAVHELPVEEREVVGLVFYHGWTKAQVAELFQVDVRTVRRRWQSACLRLAERVGGDLPRP
jgi:RNA polymerase sigma-70 factor (ECF subfamily)